MVVFMSRMRIMHQVGKTGCFPTKESSGYLQGDFEANMHA